MAYLHLTKPDLAATLSDLVRGTTWEDSANTYNDPALVFPPFVEKSAFQRIPPPKDRVDQRQGTIDTDPDFMAFLEELANPPAQPAGGAEENADTAPAPTVTPLIEYLKAKKANKDKESSSSKSARQSKQDGKSARSKGTDESKKSKEKGGDKPKEEVKILKKSSGDASKDGQKTAGTTGKAAPSSVASTSSSQAASAGEPPKSRRAGIAAAARILQRDLGLSPGTAHRRARLDAAKADAEAKSSTPANVPAPSPPPAAPKGGAGAAAPAVQAPKDQQATPKSQASGRSRGRGGKNADKGKGAENSANGPGPTAANPPVLLKKRPEQGAAQAPASPGTPNSAAPTSQKTAGTESPSKASAEKAKPAPSPVSQKKDKPSQAAAPGAARAFVKHANPSQGVTEPLLKQALGAYGTVTFVEIDKRKGFAYVDFASQEALAKAIAASPVTVAQATVQVLERKDKKPAQGAAASGAAAAGPSSGAPEKEAKEKSGHRRRGRRGGGGGGGGGEKNAGGANQGASGSAGG